MLSISELKGQRLSQGSTAISLALLDLSKNVLLLSRAHTQTSTTNELLIALA
jgi:hypothetical protein